MAAYRNICLRECKNIAFLWELKWSFVKAALSRTVHVQECPLRELPQNYNSKLDHWSYSRKIHTPTMEGILENLMGGGEFNGYRNPDGRRVLNQKRSSMLPSLQSISFEKLLVVK